MGTETWESRLIYLEHITSKMRNTIDELSARIKELESRPPIVEKHYYSDSGYEA